jgi:hypothetical protein
MLQSTIILMPAIPVTLFSRFQHVSKHLAGLFEVLIRLWFPPVQDSSAPDAAAGV